MGRIIGIAGTAKNTGKTTTLQAVVRFLRERGTGVFLTSIGYDGEDKDTVTGLPKPKVVVEEGDMVATAFPLLNASPARFSRMRPTGVDCALGHIYTGIAESPGKVVLAGPVSTKDVRSICKIAPADRLVLLDGAFSRLAPMVVADTLLLATGAARSPDSRRIAAEMETLSTVFGLPEYSGQDRGRGRLFSDGDFLRFPAGLYVEGQDETIASQITRALGLADSQLTFHNRDRERRSASTTSVFIDGVVNPTVFSSMIKRVRTAFDGQECLPSIEFVFAHPIFMLLSGEMVEWKKALAGACSPTFRVSVLHRPELLGFTVNPFRPEFDPIKNAYTALYVDASAYLKEIRSLTSARCVDIVYEGIARLESWLGALSTVNAC